MAGAGSPAPRSEINPLVDSVLPATRYIPLGPPVGRGIHASQREADDGIRSVRSEALDGLSTGTTGGGVRPGPGSARLEGADPVGDPQGGTARGGEGGALVHPYDSRVRGGPGGSRATGDHGAGLSGWAGGAPMTQALTS